MSPDPEIKSSTIYLRFHIEESAANLLCGRPQHNWIAMEMLADHIKARLQNARVPVDSFYSFGALNDANITIAVRAPSSPRRRFFRALEQLRLFKYHMGDGPWSALRAIGSVLNQYRILKSVTVHWYDASADIDRQFNRAAGDPDVPFDVHNFVKQIHVHRAVDKRREEHMATLLAILQKKTFPPPPAAPPAA